MRDCVWQWKWVTCGVTWNWVESGCVCQVYEDSVELQFEPGCDCQVYEDSVELQFEPGCDCQVYEDSMELQFESGCDCQVYEDSVELQLFFMKQRDELCRRGEVLLTPALNYTVQQLTSNIDDQRHEQTSREQQDDDDRKRHAASAAVVKASSAQVSSALTVSQPTNCHEHVRTAKKFAEWTAMCRLCCIIHPWFICWFWCYIYIVCLFTWLPPLTSFFLYLFFLTYLLPYLPFPLRIGPLHFQARGCKRRLNLGLGCLSLSSIIVFLCSWCMVIVLCSEFSYSH